MIPSPKLVVVLGNICHHDVYFWINHVATLLGCPWKDVSDRGPISPQTDYSGRRIRLVNFSRADGGVDGKSEVVVPSPVHFTAPGQRKPMGFCGREFPHSIGTIWGV